MIPVPKAVTTFALKFARILGVPDFPDFVIRDRVTSRWLGRYNGKTRTIEIQKRATHNDHTLGRVVAHEMSHHADFVSAAPGARRNLGHGASWQALAARVNRAMGPDYVTEFTSSEMVSVATRPLVVMIMEVRPNLFGYQAATRVSPLMISAMLRPFFRTARYFETTDASFARGAKIGSNRVSAAASPEEQQKLRRMYESGAHAPLEERWP